MMRQNFCAYIEGVKPPILLNYTCGILLWFMVLY